MKEKEKEKEMKRQKSIKNFISKLSDCSYAGECYDRGKKKVICFLIKIIYIILIKDIKIFRMYCYNAFEMVFYPSMFYYDHLRNKVLYKDLIITIVFLFYVLIIFFYLYSIGKNLGTDYPIYVVLLYT